MRLAYLSRMPPHPVVLATPRRTPAPYKVPWRTTFTKHTAARICEEVALGRTLERIAIEEPWAPSLALIQRWVRDYVDFKEDYDVDRKSVV